MAKNSQNLRKLAQNLLKMGQQGMTKSPTRPGMPNLGPAGRQFAPIEARRDRKAATAFKNKKEDINDKVN